VPKNRRIDDEERAFLASYDSSKFPRAAVTTDAVLLTIRDGLLSVLLIQRDGHPFKGYWALPGGFLEPDEDADTGVRRELREESGLETFPGHLEQLRTYTAPHRDPRMRIISVAYVGFVPNMPPPQAGSDARFARWWPIADIEAGQGPPLAFDHAEILADGVERARAKLEYTTLATSFVDEPFTIPDLMRVYEAVWGTKLLASNFKRKVTKSEGFVVPTGETISVGRGKGVELYVRGSGAVLTRPIMRGLQ
jgi:8-oxo-dGTP diphosphatase